jgi:TonB family protein
VTEKPKRKFLKKPRLGGGREWLREFLKNNLRYPKEALEKGIEGDVYVKFKVNEQGKVLEPKVVNGPGHGCDEEALRLVSMLQYDPVKNRGVKVTTNNRMKIPFRLERKKKPATSVRITYTPATKPAAAGKVAGTGKGPDGKGKTGSTDSAEPKKPGYGYTIQLGGRT